MEESSPLAGTTPYARSKIIAEQMLDANEVAIYLRDIWPNLQEIQETMASSINKEMFASSYADVFDGGERWKSLPTPLGKTFEWDPQSTYVRKPPYFDRMQPLHPSRTSPAPGCWPNSAIR